MSKSLRHLADEAITNRRDIQPLALTVADIARETDRRLRRMEDAALILAGGTPRPAHDCADDGYVCPANTNLGRPAGTTGTDGQHHVGCGCEEEAHRVDPTALADALMNWPEVSSEVVETLNAPHNDGCYIGGGYRLRWDRATYEPPMIVVTLHDNSDGDEIGSFESRRSLSDAARGVVSKAWEAHRHSRPIVDAHPTERRPIGWADIMPVIATYDRIVRSNRTEGYDSIAAVADANEAEIWGEVVDVAAGELGLSGECATLHVNNGLGLAVRWYRDTLRQQLAAEDGTISGR